VEFKKRTEKAFEVVPLAEIITRLRVYWRNNKAGAGILLASSLSCFFSLEEKSGPVRA
jgi:hypothetical protein